MARVGFKLGGRGRTAASESEAAAPVAPNAHSWLDNDAPVAPQAPSPAVNILPGQPFSAPPPNMSSAGGFAGPTQTPNGWGTGGPDGFGQLPPPAWTPGDPVTAPMAPVSDLTFPMSMQGGDPLDALQQYAALPYGGAAPQAGGLLADPAFQAGGAPLGYAAAPMAAPAVPEHAFQPVGQPEAQTQPHPTPHQAPQPIAQSAESGFADGGIFTGAPFEPAPFEPASFEPTQSTPQHAFGADPAVPAGSAVPPASAVPAFQTGPLPSAPMPPFQTAQLPQLPLQSPVPQPPLPTAFGQVPVPPADVLPSASPFPFPADLGAEADEEREGRRRRKGRRRAAATESDAAPSSRSGVRRIGALVGVAAVLAAASWVGYGQLNSTPDSTPAPFTPRPHAAAPAATPRITLPAQLATLTQVPSARASQLAHEYSTTTGRVLPALPAPAVVSGYHAAGQSAVAVSVVVYKPAAASADAGYLALVGQLSRPRAGNVSVPATPVAPGAAGGSMLCGSQRGASAGAWCAWKNGTTVGSLQTSGSSDVAFAAVYTRELRAYAER